MKISGIIASDQLNTQITPNNEMDMHVILVSLYLFLVFQILKSKITFSPNSYTISHRYWEQSGLNLADHSISLISVQECLRQSDALGCQISRLRWFSHQISNVDELAKISEMIKTDYAPLKGLKMTSRTQTWYHFPQSFLLLQISASKITFQLMYYTRKACYGHRWASLIKELVPFIGNRYFFNLVPLTVNS